LGPSPNLSPAPVAKSQQILDGTSFTACSQAGNSCCYHSSKLDKSILIAPNLSPLFEIPNRILDWDPCITRAPSRQQLLLSGSSKLDKSVLIGTLPLTQPPKRNPNRILDWDLCVQHERQATAAIRDQQQADKSVLIGTCP
jgi:hypothetical protein